MARFGRFVPLLLAASVLIWDLRLHAQAHDAPAVLAAARDARGGEKSLSAIKTFVATGRTRQIRGNNMVPVEFEIACELPDKYVRRDEFPAQDQPPAINGFRGDQAIGNSKTTREDFARLMLGVTAASTPALPLTFTYAAEGDAPEGKADVLAVSGPANFSAQFVVQRETHLPVVLMWKAPGPAASADHRLYFADFRGVNGGVKWPFRIRHALATVTIEETTFDRVSINAKIDPKTFEASQ